MNVNNQIGLGQFTALDNSILDSSLKLVSLFLGAYRKLLPWVNVVKDLLDLAASQVCA